MSTRYQIQAFQRQFPAIFSAQSEIIAREVTDVEVSRVTSLLLGRRPHAETASGNLINRGDVERYFLLAEDWRILGEVVQEREDWTPRGTDTQGGETIGEAIVRLGVAALVAYVVRTARYYSDQPGDPEDSYSVMLYKPPRGWTIAGWVAEQERRASTALAAQIAEIEAEGETPSAELIAEITFAREYAGPAAADRAAALVRAYAAHYGVPERDTTIRLARDAAEAAAAQSEAP